MGKYSRFVQYQENALLQSLLVPIIPDDRYGKDDVISKLLRRTSYEPGIMLAEQLVKRKLTHRDFELRSNQLPSQVVNIYRALGIIRTPKSKIDPMGEILAKRYRIKNWQGWQELFKTDYIHAFQILSYAEAVFASGRSEWLNYQNSFNNALFLALQLYLKMHNKPGTVNFKDRKGRLEKYGRLIDPKETFAKIYPSIATGLKLCNDRRNTLPGSHPYEEKSGTKTYWLQKKEQTDIMKQLKIAYGGIIKIVEGKP